MKIKRIFSLLLVIGALTLLLTLSIGSETHSGTCGSGLTWELDTGSGELTIQGTGDMSWYSDSNGITTAPWGTYYKSIKKVIFTDGVTSIGNRAFWGCSNIISITIPNSVTSIGGSAFYGCSSLTEVTIGGGVTSIGDDAFEGCSSLTQITIPDSVTSIGGYAFYGCSSLTQITIPDSVTSIGVGAFSGCSSLTKLYITDLAAWCNVSLSSYSSAPFASSGKGTLYLNGTPVTELVIPDSVTSIGYEAFYGCSSLTSITIPDSVTSIGVGAFSGCSSLTSITIPDSVTRIGYEAFYGCSSLVRITICSKNASIYDGSFTIPSTAFIRGYVGSTAEAYAKKYGRVFLDIEKDTSVVKSGICGAEGKNLTWELSDTGLLTISGTGAMKSGDAAWANYKGYVKRIVLKSGITSIAANAFNGCSTLQSITIPRGVISIGNKAFYGCSRLTSVTIPDSVTYLGDSAFYECDSLREVFLGNGLTSIGSSVFEYCRSLTQIHIPSNVTSIGSWAFYGCSSLKEIHIPSKVKNIHNYAFSGCLGLTSVTIPDSVTSIGSDAFDSCSALEKVTVYAKDVSIADSATTFPSNATIYGYVDSTAEIYALTYGHSFEALDADAVQPEDPAPSTPPELLPDPRADMNGDGKVDTNDAIYLLRHILMPKEYPLYLP